MDDNTTIAVVIVVAVVVLAVVMIVVICQQSKAQAEVKLATSRRQQRRNSRMIGRAFSHRYFNPFGETKTTPNNNKNNNGNNNDNNDVSDHVEQVTDESPVFVVDEAVEPRGTLGNVSDLTVTGHPNTIAVPVPEPRYLNTVTHSLQVPTEPEYPPLSTSGQVEDMYSYIPHPLPPLKAAPTHAQYNSPRESRGTESD
ncbi:hybrid signal transduction histidine kinase I-like [Haliotis rufescens]|uniref:hybrid signal transduction histidine kinase I-like n=1 Tax=Haliotis rufescens TaxID=6454 RepID=UPI00201EC9BF|nr:hybrid signal transduction histidine kinase I-like [Haliotis rufescens]XP_046373175.2 hybrid signal transduction histidine kinase I-like [Haliotis rufescens]XP_046373176.2 hybrid signal transduction histidine kinase I-like [Haliotis rufescens]